MKKILSIFIFLFIFLCLTSCGTESKSIHTELQNSYINAEEIRLVPNEADGKSEQSRPLPLHFDWNGDSDKYIVSFKTEEDEIVYETDTNSIDIYNLKINTSYTWYVNDEKQGEFIIEDKLRNLYISGMTNCRDLGGYLANGKMTNQGLLIRTSKLKQNYTGENLITEKGIAQLQQLGIKTDIDLRSDSVTDNGQENGNIDSSAGNINYIAVPMTGSGEYLTPNLDKLPQLFHILGDKSNYPIIFHCSIGTDRTGMVAFLINALLGVEEHDLYLDYLFSNFGNIGSMRNYKTIDTYIHIVTNDEDKSLSENVYNYLIDNGVDKSDIDNLIKIMTE